jgi:hypothetical protein
MMDRQIWRALLVIAAIALALACAPGTGFAFPQSTETSGEILPDLTGTWLVVNRLEFPLPSPEAAEPSPKPTPKAGAGAVRPFSVGYIFEFEHLLTADAQKLREEDKAKKQAAVDKATKILFDEQRKAAADPKPLASGELPVEPKVLSYGIPKSPDSVADLHDEVTVRLLDVDLPKDIQDDIDKANKANEAWEPTDKELATLKSGWKGLKPREKSEYSKIDWKVVEGKYMDTGMQQDEKTKDAKFVISGDATLIASPGQANRSILIYGIRKTSDKVIEGGHVRAIMTSAPFPIPIDMKGSFKMYRLTDVPKPKDK